MSGQFENLRASSLYCARCRKAMPVRERLLLVLPDRDLYDYLCTGCGDSVGRREITVGEKMLAAARRPNLRVPAPPGAEPPIWG